MYKLNTQCSNNPICTWAKKMHRQFSKEGIQVEMSIWGKKKAFYIIYSGTC